MTALKGKTVFITGASRGIGLAVALRMARDGANIAIAAKTTTPDARLVGTIHTAAEQIERAGGRALAVACDIRFEEQVLAAVDKTVAEFGGVDICINNASAISPTPTLQTTMKKFDLMHQVNTRGTFLVSKACIPHLLRADNPHILNMSPPLTLEPTRWSRSLAYTMAKQGMSLCVLGMAEEFKSQGIAVNAMWPRGMVATAAISNVLGGRPAMLRSKKPEMIAEATYTVVTKASRECTGNFFIDEQVLLDAGVTDMSIYRVTKADLDDDDQYIQR